ncbi:MAG: TIM-barrel domain-containing protein [Bacteroidota bacterium]
MKLITITASLLLIWSIYSCAPIDDNAQIDSNTNYIHDITQLADTTMDLPPAWAFGVLWGGYTTQTETMERIDSILAMDLPIDGYHIDSWFCDAVNKGAGPDGYLDFIGDTISYPDMKGMWDYMEENHIKSGIWVWNMMHQTGNEAHYKIMDDNNWHLKKIVNTKGWHNKGKSVFDPIKQEYTKESMTLYADFSQQECYDYYHENFKHFFDKGLDYVKLDNHTHVPYMKVFYEMIQKYGKETEGRAYIMTHAWNYDEEQMANFKRFPVKWTDDTEIAWKDSEEGKWPHGGLIDNVEHVTRPDGKVHDVPFFTIDAGGFNYSRKFMKSEVVVNADNNFGGGAINSKLMIPVDTELYMRWIQFANFLPVMQIFCGAEVPTAHLPWRHSNEAYENFKMLTHLRMQLFPYIYSYAHQCRVDGGTMVTSDTTHFHQYNFGKELLVAPVVEHGATTKEVFFPEGEWIDFWDGKRFEGGKSAIVEAPLEKIPLFVKSGAIIPMRPYTPNVATGSRENFQLKVYPGKAASSFSLYEDDGTSKDYKNGIYAQTDFSCLPVNAGYEFKIAPTLGYYKDMPTSKSYEIQFMTDKHPTKISAEGAKLTWEYKEAEGLISINLSTSNNQQVLIKIQ